VFEAAETVRMAAWHVAVTVAPFHAPAVGGPAVAVFGAQYFLPVS
jgi:hypothetical protein